MGRDLGPFVITIVHDINYYYMALCLLYTYIILCSHSQAHLNWNLLGFLTVAADSEYTHIHIHVTHCNYVLIYISRQEHKGLKYILLTANCL